MSVPHENPPHEPSRLGSASSGQHFSTISYDGRFWDVYIEFTNDPRQPSSYRGLFCFSPADGDPDARRTTTIIIEDSYEEALAKAQAMEGHELQGLLRSVLPDLD
jgi:hypothetical protein